MKQKQWKMRVSWLLVVAMVMTQLLPAVAAGSGLMLQAKAAQEVKLPEKMEIPTDAQILDFGVTDEIQKEQETNQVEKEAIAGEQTEADEADEIEMLSEQDMVLAEQAEETQIPTLNLSNGGKQEITVQTVGKTSRVNFTVERPGFYQYTVSGAYRYCVSISTDTSQKLLTNEKPIVVYVGQTGTYQIIISKIMWNAPSEDDYYNDYYDDYYDEDNAEEEEVDEEMHPLTISMEAYTDCMDVTESTDGSYEKDFSMQNPSLGQWLKVDVSKAGYYSVLVERETDNIYYGIGGDVSLYKEGKKNHTLHELTSNSSLSYVVGYQNRDDNKQLKHYWLSDQTLYIQIKQSNKVVGDHYQVKLIPYTTTQTWDFASQASMQVSYSGGIVIPINCTEGRYIISVPREEMDQVSIQGQLLSTVTEGTVTGLHGETDREYRYFEVYAPGVEGDRELRFDIQNLDGQQHAITMTLQKQDVESQTQQQPSMHISYHGEKIASKWYKLENLDAKNLILSYDPDKKVYFALYRQVDAYNCYRMWYSYLGENLLTPNVHEELYNLYDDDEGVVDASFYLYVYTTDGEKMFSQFDLDLYKGMSKSINTNGSFDLESYGRVQGSIEGTESGYYTIQNNGKQAICFSIEQKTDTIHIYDDDEDELEDDMEGAVENDYSEINPDKSVILQPNESIIHYFAFGEKTERNEYEAATVTERSSVNYEIATAVTQEKQTISISVKKATETPEKNIVDLTNATAVQTKVNWTGPYSIYSFTPQIAGAHAIVTTNPDAEFSIKLAESKDAFFQKDAYEDLGYRLEDYNHKRVHACNLEKGKTYYIMVTAIDNVVDGLTIQVQKRDNLMVFDYDEYNAFIASGGTIQYMTYQEVSDYLVEHRNMTSGAWIWGVVSPNEMFFDDLLGKYVLLNKDTFKPEFKNVTWVPKVTYMSSKPLTITAENLAGELKDTRNGAKYEFAYVADTNGNALAGDAVLNTNRPIVLAKYAPKNVMVQKINVVGAVSLEAGKSEQLAVTLSSGNAFSITNKVVHYASSNPAVASVDAKGLITGVSNGSCVITITSDDGNAMASVAVTVAGQQIVPTQQPTAAPQAPVTGQTTDDKKTATFEVTNTEKKEVTYEAPVDTKEKVVKVPETTTINGQTYTVTEIAPDAFKSNTTITKVTIGKNITTIGKNAFSGAKNLTTVTMGKNVEEIGDNAFKGCNSLKTVTLTPKVSDIGANAFKGCKKLTTITIKSTKLTDKNVSKKAFSGITNKTTIKVPKKKLVAYKTLFKKKGLSSKVKVTAI